MLSQPTPYPPRSEDQHSKIFELLKQEILQRRSDIRRLRHEISELHARLKTVEDASGSPESSNAQPQESTPLPAIFGQVKARLESALEAGPATTESDQLEESQKAVDELFNNNSSMENKIELPSAPVFDNNPTVYEDPEPQPAEFEDGGDDFSEYENNSVDTLRNRLHEQLKRAEVEMSLERARVFQQKAELEELKIQIQQLKGAKHERLEQRDVDFENRLNRHLEHHRNRQKVEI